jgi:hypothetical protein
MKKGLFYVAVLTGLYIVASRATNAGTLITDTANGGAKFVSTLQGR